MGLERGYQKLMRWLVPALFPFFKSLKQVRHLPGHLEREGFAAVPIDNDGAASVCWKDLRIKLLEKDDLPAWT